MTAPGLEAKPNNIFMVPWAPTIIQTGSTFSLTLGAERSGCCVRFYRYKGEREILFSVLASAKDKTAWLLSATRRRTGVRNKLDKHYCLTGIVGVGPGRKTDSDQDSDSAVCNGFQSVNCDRFISYQSIALLLDSVIVPQLSRFVFFNYFVPHTRPCPGSNMPVLHHHLTFGRQSDETMMICLAVWLSGPQKANSWMVLACELLAVILQNTPTSALHKLGIFERKEFWRW